MQLTKDQIEEYQKIYKEVFGVEISEEESVITGHKLIKLIKQVYYPDSEYKN